jgi:hypothetical protein
MRTSDTHIWGVGDAIETHDVITDQPTVIPSPDPRIVKAVSPQMQSTGARRSSEESRARPCAVFLA